MNKPTKTIVALCLLNSANAYALGVGEIKTNSALNQTLNAQIPLVGSKKEDPSNIRIGIASREIFQKAGIDRPHYLTQLQFTPVLSKNGEITIDVRSASTIKEPFVNFILEVEWPQGRTLKEFTILLDPPVTMSDVQTTPLALPKSPTITPTAPNNIPEATYVTPSAQQVSPKEYGPIRSVDTVWSIAKRLVANDRTVSHQQMMLALYDNNPKAFYKKNINALKKGAILQVPSSNQIKSRTALQANNEFNDHSALWSSSSKAASTPITIPKANRADRQTARIGGNKKSENNVVNPTLSLLTPNKKTKIDIPVEGNTVDTPVGAASPTSQANIAIEMATTLEEENKEVKSRLNDLETQVDKLQRLLSLKDKQLAQLQSVKSAVEPKPKNTPTPVAEEESNLPLYGFGLVIVLLGLFLARRKKQRNNLFTEEATDTPTYTEDIIEKTETTTSEDPLLSEFTPSEFNSSPQTQEADPLTECDVYIAYGRFQQAEDIIKKALDSDAANLTYKLKLLDVYFASENSDSFEELASTMSSLQDSDPVTWNSIADMGADINPDSTLFLSPLNEEVETKKASTPKQNTEHELEFDYSDESTENQNQEPEPEPEEIQEEEEEEEDSVEENNTTNEFEFDFDLIKNKPSEDNQTEKSESVELDGIDMPSSDSSEDHIETMFSLAQASIEMEDIESAKDTLNEILESGGETNKQKAQEMLDNL